MRTALVCSILLISASALETWPRFRGTNGSGFAETTLPAQWDPASPHFKTRLPGIGHGSPVIWGNKVFLLSADATTGKRHPMALDAHSGAIQWQLHIADATHKHHKFNSFASSTPALDAKQAYFAWGTPESQTVLACTHDGTEVWRVDLGPVEGGHGYAASPMVFGDLLVLNRDQDRDGFLVALETTTGKERWRIPRKSKRLSYSTAVHMAHPAGDQLIFTNWQHGFTGVDPKTGTVLWDKTVFDTTTKERAISSPVVVGDLVIGTCGFTTNPKHCVALRVGKDGAEEVWRIEKSVPHIPSLLIAGAYVFLWEDKGIVSCVAHQTGETIWKERVRGEISSSPVRAGEHIYAVTRDGLIHCIHAGPELKPLGRTDLETLVRSSPAIAHRTLYIRTAEHLIAFR